MNGQMKTEKYIPFLATGLLGILLAAANAFAQVPVDDSGNVIGTYSEDGFDDERQSGESGQPLSAAELEELVGPVALYPDDLLAIVLPASTYPLEIVQAARFLEQVENDSSLKPDETWDESVVALLNYPEVVRMMDQDIDWTWRLGEAVLNQQNDVIAAVESFRDRAYAAGNLKSDEHQEVKQDDDGIIEIVPVDEEIIYVPYYEPAEVVVYQPRRVYYYYPDPYPVYYYPYPVGYDFHSGFFWGVTTAFTIGWSNHYLHVYHPSYWGHPYYGRYYNYYGYYYRRPSITVYNTYYVTNNYHPSRYRYRDGDYWRPRTRVGSRPDAQYVRNYHFSPNGTSANSRNFTVTPERRLRVGDDGRMDLRLRERDGLSRSGNRRTVEQGSSARVARQADNRRDLSSSSSARRDRQSVPSTAGTARTRQVTTGQRLRTATTGTSDRVTTGARRPTGSSRDRVAATGAPPTSRRQTGSSRDRVAATGAPPTSRRQTPSRMSVTPETSSHRNAVVAGDRREVSPSAGRYVASGRSSPSASNREAAVAQRVAPAPRAQAPSIQRAQPAPREASRSSGRSNDGGRATSGSRSRSGGRVRDNH